MTILQKHLVFIPLFLIMIVALLGSLVLWLWNWLMPAIFGLPELTIWQAIGLLVLCRLLVGNIGFGNHHAHQHGHCKRDEGKSRLREKWSSMTPQERRHIINKYMCDEKETINEDGR